MKFAVALSAAVAPMALAKAVHNVYPIRRDGLDARGNSNKNNNDGKNGGVGSNSISINDVQLAAEQSFLLSQVAGSLALKGEAALLEEVLLLWVNPGGVSATTIINVSPAATIVSGSTGGSVGAPPPPPVQTQAAGGAVGATNTVVAGATGTAAVAATGQTHQVQVGAGGLAYTPSSLTAAVGDTVIFTFVSANHTATQSAFATPCDPLAGGMDSGFQPNANGTVNPPPQVAMQVQVATPLCKSMSFPALFLLPAANHAFQGSTAVRPVTAERA